MQNRKDGPNTQEKAPEASSHGSLALNQQASTRPTVIEKPESSDLPTMIDLGPAKPSSAEAATSIDLGPGPSRAATIPSVTPFSGGVLLQPGTLLGSRYEIVQLLGEGGMGAVYKAVDRELDRVIALKVIRPDLAGRPEILQRFKQELILARQVTDTNIIRIFDLGEADGIRFITMEFVEGQTLHEMLRTRGKLPVSEVVETLEQTLSGLRAAHRAGVIHRDLKPGNIMRDAQGRVVIMDFGLARSLEGDGMTRTGAMLGTMEYMSPEQALGTELDARSDLFTVGLICYELLTGKMPFHADSAVASLLRRTRERAVPMTDLDREIPGVFSNIISKCLERDPALRYQSAQAVLDDLHAWQGKGSKSRISASSSALLLNRLREVSWRRIAIGVVALAVVVVLAMYLGRNRTPNAGQQHTPVSVLVADFQNNTSDPLFDDTLEPMFDVALEGASFVNAYNRTNARKLAAKLPNPATKLDEQAARLVAVREGVSAIVTGSLNSRGSGYEISVQAFDAMTGKLLADAKGTAANKDELLLDIPKLAAPIRKALGDTTPESVQLAATQGSFATSNLEAVHQYSIAMEQQFSGKWQDALQSFSKAADLDPNFARAYAGMAAAAGNLGQMQDAEKYAKLAMAHVDRMTERERFRVRGLYYIRTENWKQCIEEYGELVKQYPADNIGQNNLAFCYARLLNMPKAMDQARQALQTAPKDVMTRMNFALYSCYATDFPSCEREAHAVLQLNPAYEEGFLALGYAQVGQNELPQAAETYQKLQKVSPWGESLGLSGLGDLALYQGRLREAADIFEKGAAADLAAKKPDAAADKFVMLAYAKLLQRDNQSAIAAAEKALANSESIKTRFLAARVLVEAGATAKAQKLAASLGSSLQAAPQAYAKLILGEVMLKEKNPKQAIQSFTEAKDLMDSWIGRFDLGRAYLDAGAFAEADSEFDRCLKRRGEALELFMDDMPTYSYLPAVYYYQGRVREGLKSPGFADSYRTYLNLRAQSAEDPLVADIRHRLGQ
ncbi:MAG TPA: protein kinase [Terriglobales bacterium]|nr:protein kinase [Terriglobales bacterium]